MASNLKQEGEEIDELVRENRNLRFEIARLNEKSTELTMKMASVDNMYQKDKLQLMRAVEDRQMLQLSIEQIKKQQNSKTDEPSLEFSAELLEQWRKINSEMYNILKKQGQQVHIIPPLSVPPLNDQKSLRDCRKKFSQHSSKLLQIIQKSYDRLNQSLSEHEEAANKNNSIIRKFKNKHEQAKSMDDCLREELERITEEKAELLAQLNICRQSVQENARKVQYYEKMRENESKKRQMEDNVVISSDNNFAVQLLLVQKSQLQKLFQRVIVCQPNKQQHNWLTELLAIQLEILDLEKSKIEISFELEELQCFYKKQCDRGTPGQLIQVRKKIQLLRQQLSTVNSELSSCKGRLEVRIQDYQAHNHQEERARNYSIDAEKRLAKTKLDLEEYRTGIETKLSRRMSDDYFKDRWEGEKITKNVIPQARQTFREATLRENIEVREAGEGRDGRESSQKPSTRSYKPADPPRILFYQTNQAEQALQTAVDHDRQKMEKLFEETRNRLQRVQQVDAT